MNTITYAECRRIWRTAVIDPESTTLLGLTLMMGLAAILATLVHSLMHKNLVVGIGYGTGVPLSMLALYAWYRFATGVSLQNAPACACLVPGLNHRLRVATALVWCLTMVPLVMVGIAGDDSVMFIVVSAMGVISMGLLCAGRLMFMWPAVAASWTMMNGQTQLLLATSEYRPVMLALLVVAVLAFGAYALAAGLPRGGKQHWDMVAARGSFKAMDDWSTFHDQMGKRKARGLYAMLLRRDASTPGLRRYLLLHALGPSCQRLSFAVPFLIGLAVVVLARPLAALLGMEFGEFAGRVSAMAGMGMLGMGLFLFRFNKRMWRTGAEQALVRLTPAMPRATILNRELAGQILRTCLSDWAAIAVVTLSAVTLWFDSFTAIQIATALLLGILTGSSNGLGNYTSKSEFCFETVVMSHIGSFILLIISLFWMKNLAVWSSLMLLMLLQSVATIYYRWKLMVESPVAFPAGRMA